MDTNTNIYTDERLTVVASLRDGAIQASIVELRERDKLTLALRSGLKIGIPIEDLSEASGISPAEIRRRTKRDLMILTDLDSLSGNV